MSEELDKSIPLNKPKQRLKFIDMARSIAILLMLEGHFIGCTLAEQEMYHNTKNTLYTIWNFVRGFTAPMFFTVTGVVFIYLLTMSKDVPFFKNKRVKIGFRRSLELLFWGYLLQMNVSHIGSYFTGHISNWVFAFHVLQCIGLGISVLLLIYGLYKLINKGALATYYFIAGTLLFSFYPFFRHQEDVKVLIEKVDKFEKKDSYSITRTEYNDIKYLLYQLSDEELEKYQLYGVKSFYIKSKLANIKQIAALHSLNRNLLKVNVKKETGNDTFYPLKAPPIVQNLFRGEYSVFPIVPWLAFTLYGGMVGALLNRNQHRIKKTWFPLTFIGLGLILNLFGWSMFKAIDSFSKMIHFHDDLDFVQNAWLYGRIGQVLIVLGVLMFIEKYFHIKDSLFIKVGQNTLSIYIVHVAILYGGIFGIGLKDLYAKSLTPFQAILGAIIFIASFVIFVKYIERIRLFIENIKLKIFSFIRFKKN
jgi:surface polysaccharide O-acyltransferase-like enzyme